MLQLPVVNVTEPGDTVPSLGSLELTLTVTFAVGCVSRTTVKVSKPPASVVIKPLVGFTVIPAVSSSWFVTDTSDGLMPL